MPFQPKKHSHLIEYAQMVVVVKYRTATYDSPWLDHAEVLSKLSAHNSFQKLKDSYAKMANSHPRNHPLHNENLAQHHKTHGVLPYLQARMDHVKNPHPSGQWLARRHPILFEILSNTPNSTPSCRGDEAHLHDQEIQPPVRLHCGLYHQDCYHPQPTSVNQVEAKIKWRLIWAGSPLHYMWG